MPDQSSYPVNDKEWKYDLALNAVTGGTFDLHQPAKPKDGWLTWDADLTTDKNDVWFQGPIAFSYTTYYALKINKEALKAWTDAVDAITTVISAVHTGNYGTMSRDTLYDFYHLANELAGWLGMRSREFHTFAKDLGSGDSKLKGTAAYVIYDRLKHYGDGLDDLLAQLTTKNGVGVPNAAHGAYSALQTFSLNIATRWSAVADYFRDFARLHVNWWLQQVDAFVNRPGLWNNLGGFNNDGYYRGKLAEFPWPDGGTADLTKPETWERMNTDITTRLLAEIKTHLDDPTVPDMTKLREAYEKNASAIVPLVAPVTPKTVLPKPDSGDGPNTSNTPNLEGPNTSNTPNLEGPNTSNVPNLGGPDTSNLPPLDGSGLRTSTPPPGGLPATGMPPGGGPLGGGGAGTVGSGVGFPGLFLPPGSNRSQTGSPNSEFRSGPAARTSIPDLGGLPAGGGLPGTVKVPGGGGVRSANLPRSSSGLHLPELAPPPGGGAGLGPDGLGGADRVASGLTGLGSGSGVGGAPGTGGAPGAAGGPGSGLGPTGLLGGGSGAGGPAGAPGSEDKSGGVPFFPPMMGGMGGGAGEKPQERERQTWLAEDEAVWGTDVDAGSGVIGRREDGDGRDDELAGALPGEELRHPAVSRHRRSPAERAEERTEEGVAHRVGA